MTTMTGDPPVCRCCGQPIGSSTHLAEAVPGIAWCRPCWRDRQANELHGLSLPCSRKEIAP